MNRRGFLGGVVALLGFRPPAALLEGPAAMREGDLVGGRVFLGVDHGLAESAGRVLVAMTPLGKVEWVQQFLDGPPTLQDFLSGKGSYAARFFDEPR